MNSGDLRHRITIQKLINTYNDFGESTKEWANHKQVWAAITPAIGKNYYAAEQTQTDAKVKINTRYLSDITRDMRINYNGIIYDIIDIMDVNTRHEELVIYCSEVIAK